MPPPSLSLEEACSNPFLTLSPPSCKPRGWHSGGASRSAGRSGARICRATQLPAPTPRPAHRLMALVAPNAFTNELAQWVGDKCMKSIVFVELRPKNPDKVQQWWDPVFNAAKEQTEQENIESLGSSEDFLCCTGSVVKNDNGNLSILTCAHVLGPAFNHKCPITAARVNDLYRSMILCDHQEERFQDKKVERRVYMRAKVSHIDGSKDIMVLRVVAAEVQNCCPNPHPPLRMAKSFPKRFVRVVMLSWPPNAHRTAVEGRISHPSRLLHTIYNENPRDHRMKLSEVDISSEVGSSGAPLLNGLGNYVGLLFGGNRMFSFYVSFEDLRETLTRWGLV